MMDLRKGSVLLILLSIFGAISTVSAGKCRYFLTADDWLNPTSYIYNCELQEIIYTNGSEEFKLADDEHLEGYNDLHLEILLSTREFPLLMTYFPALLFSKFPNLKQISISDASIQNIEKIFENCAKLEEVFLDWNDVDELPSGSFGKCQNLIHLSLDQNNINNIAADAFANLTSLQSLSLSYNPIESLHSAIFDDLVNLKTLELMGTGLIAIPTGLFGNLNSLQWLGLGFNRLKRIETGTFKQLPSLRRLFIRFNCPSIEFENLAFESLDNLEDLDLEANYINQLNSSAFGRLPNLRWLNMKGNLADNIEQNFISQFPQLEKVHKSNVPVEDEEAYNRRFDHCYGTASSFQISIFTILGLIFLVIARF